jgi:hypothetical protein
MLRRRDGTPVYQVAGCQTYTSRAVVDAEQRILTAARTSGGCALSAVRVGIALGAPPKRSEQRLTCMFLGGAEGDSNPFSGVGSDLRICTKPQVRHPLYAPVCARLDLSARAEVGTCTHRETHLGHLSPWKSVRSSRARRPR